MRRSAPSKSRIPLAGFALSAALLLAAMALPHPAHAGSESNDPGWRQFEVTAGLGGAGSAEDDLFNLPVDEGSSPELLIDFRLRQNFSDRLAFGFHIYGNTEQTPDYVATDSIGLILDTFHYRLTVLHVGFDARWFFLPPPFQPFVELGLSYVSGTVDGGDYGNLQLNGVSFGGGPGLQYRLHPAIAVGAQGLFTLGTAKWEQVPFPGLSSGRDFNPGFVGAEGFLTWRWGAGRR